MSSLPGLSLEDYVMWNHDLIVDGDDEANESRRIAEITGTVPRRRELTAAEFAPILAVYEPYRDSVENSLEWFDDESQSWRDYSCSAFDFIPQQVFDEARKLLDSPLPQGDRT